MTPQDQFVSTSLNDGKDWQMETRTATVEKSQSVSVSALITVSILDKRQMHCIGCGIMRLSETK